jgi:cytoskeletal protein CcmA (bactofilin family)
MFERTKTPVEPASPVTSAPQPSAPSPDAAARTAASSPAAGARGRTTAIIGPSIQIDGTLRGQEDLFVEGEVTGTIQLQNHTLTIGTQGKIKADVYAHTVFVEGSMDGDLFGSEQVIVRKSARVRGNITSPRVTLEDGASFKGSIEMDPESVKGALGSNSSGQRHASMPAASPTMSAARPAAPPATPIGNASSQSR